MADTSAPAGWLGRLKSGLTKTSAKLNDGIVGLFTKRKLDAETLEGLEELLVSADLGAKTAKEIVAKFARTRFEKEVLPQTVKEELADDIAQILVQVARPFSPERDHSPHVVLMVGVNGNGKTTTIGKLASALRRDGKSVMLAAADTFRAAAVEQLAVWADRAGCPIIRGEAGADSASVAYKAVEQAKAQKIDVLFIDSAGRLQNKTNLMSELQKIIKVIKKVDETAPHSVIQVLDATTGQNALSQVEIFQSMVNVTGLVITKLDGTAKGGIVVAVAERFKLPIHAIGVGESVEDLKPFSAADYARNLLGMQ